MNRIALIGDIVSSREAPGRAALQQRLADALAALNKHGTTMLSSYALTRGDEVEAVFRNADELFGHVVSLLVALHPARMRFAFGVGEIDTPIDSKRPQAMDGPAFHRARAGLERLKRTPYLFSLGGLQHESAALIEQSLWLASHAMNTWKPNRLRVLSLMLDGASAKQTADVLHLSVQAVYKNIEAGALRVVASVFTEATCALNREVAAP